eukprot:11205208-Lingulodinium_polyedra.AAC.1
MALIRGISHTSEDLSPSRPLPRNLRPDRSWHGNPQAAVTPTAPGAASLTLRIMSWVTACASAHSKPPGHARRATRRHSLSFSHRTPTSTAAPI